MIFHNILWLLAGVVESWGALCSKSTSKGPFKITEDRVNITSPSKRSTTAQRITITREVEMAVMHRAYWKSYCYNGGALDPNTGCFSGLIHDLPDYTESKLWIASRSCAIGTDCTDCWGSDAIACLEPEKVPKKMVSGKELVRKENNDHFAFHTCNLSWRCGINRSRFPTFITRRDDDWVVYTEFANGTELILDTRDYWVSEDYSLRKVTDYQTKTERKTLSCFYQNRTVLACYDREFGNFIEFKKEWACQGHTCYLLTGKFNFVHEKRENEHVNLKAASIEDLKTIISAEHMINEELRYNFGLVLEELTSLRNIMRKMIISVAKIDDRLLGNIMDQSARSRFINDDIFYLSPCADPEKRDSNCVGGLMFSNGRWVKKTDEAKCDEEIRARAIPLFKKQELWFPEFQYKQPEGTIADIEGWTYYAHQKDDISEAIKWVKNGQSTTSLGDIYDLPKGFITASFWGFVTSHAFSFMVLGIVVIWTLKKSAKRQRHGREIQSISTNIQLDGIISTPPTRDGSPLPPTRDGSSAKQASYTQDSHGFNLHYA